MGRASGRVQVRTEPPAQNRSLRQRLQHNGLKKAENSLAIPTRTGEIELAACLYAREVLGVESASCSCE